MVAEVGFEPHDLRVMSPTSYQAALLRDIVFFDHSGGAGDRDRTGTMLSHHGILSPGRLPVPPHRRDCAPHRFANDIISYPFAFVNPFFKICKKIFFIPLFLRFLKKLPRRALLLSEVLFDLLYGDL